MNTEVIFKAALLIFASADALYGALVLFNPRFRDYMWQSMWAPKDGQKDWFPGLSGKIFDFYVRGVIPLVSGIILALLVLFVL